jgi:transcriptional regulator with XRE-family HTH domain
MSIRAADPEWTEHIRRLMTRHHLSQADLAARLGVSRATVTRWMKGTHEPTSASYLALGNMLSPVEAMFFWERAGVDPANFPETKLRGTLSSLRVDLREFTLVLGKKLTRGVVNSKSNAVILPLLNVTAHGDELPPKPHVTLSQADVVDILMAPLSWCPHPENMLCMQVSGNSMEPLIPSGSILAVDTGVTDRAALHKELAVFSHRDLGFKVARLQRLPNSDILLSANHNYLPVDVTDQAKWKVVGKVSWWVSKDALPDRAKTSRPPKF